MHRVTFQPGGGGVGGIAVVMTTGNPATLLDLIWRKDAALRNPMEEVGQKCCLMKRLVCVRPAGLAALLLMHYTASLA